jgi:hypothetical protein
LFLALPDVHRSRPSQAAADFGGIWCHQAILDASTSTAPLDIRASDIRASRKKRAHEGPLIAEHTPALVPDAVGRNEVRVIAEQAAVLLVRSEAREAEQGQRLVACAFGRQEVAVVAATMPVNQLHPPPGETLEGIDPRRVDDILHDTGDHGGRLAHATRGNPSVVTSVSSFSDPVSTS